MAKPRAACNSAKSGEGLPRLKSVCACNLRCRSVGMPSVQHRGTTVRIWAYEEESPQGHARAQARDAEELIRQEGQKPEAGDRDSSVRIWTVKTQTGKVVPARICAPFSLSDADGMGRLVDRNGLHGFEGSGIGAVIAQLIRNRLVARYRTPRTHCLLHWGRSPMLSSRAVAASIAVLTAFLSSAGGRTAGKPKAFSHNSRHQPCVW